MIPLLAASTMDSWFAPEALPRLPQRVVEWLLAEAGLPPWIVTLGGWAAAAFTVVGVFASLFALLSLIERKTLARAQNRIGPNRAGWFGILQPVADGIKMLTKEDLVPDRAEKIPHLLAPILVVVPAVVSLGLIPLGSGWVPLPLEYGLLLFFAVGAMTEVAVFLAGWSSGSKFPLLGAMRAISQMVSYELPLIITALAVVMATGTLALPDIVRAQEGYHLGIIPAWNILTPWGLVGGILFFIATIAESNRCPFDLPEGESEIVAGHMTEYSGFKYALFFMGEYLGLFAISGMFITLFLGGWQAPLPGLGFVPSWCWFFGKLAVVIFLFLWIRATYPRLRMDQLMRFAWLWMTPFALFTLPAVAIWHATGRGVWSWLAILPLAAIPCLLSSHWFNRNLAASTRTYRYADD